MSFGWESLPSPSLTDPTQGESHHFTELQGDDTMSSDFTVIFAVRQRFGDSDPEFSLPQELEAPFVGASKEFAFACPGVDSTEMAVLQFESFGIGAGTFQPFVVPQPPPRNVIRINGTDLPGGLTPVRKRRLAMGLDRTSGGRTRSLCQPMSFASRTCCSRGGQVSPYLESAESRQLHHR